MSERPRRRRPVVVAGAGTSYPDVDVERRTLASTTIIDACELSPEETAKACRRADAILTDYFPCDASLIGTLERCKVISNYGVGYDQIDVAAAGKRGIQVTNNPEYCIDEVAEHTIALLLSAWRRIPAYDRDVRAGGWDYGSQPAAPLLRGSTLGVVGFGRIGRAVTSLASALGVHVVVHDPYLDQKTVDVETKRLADLLSVADAVTLHLPLTPATESMIGGDQLSWVKPTAGLINTARGALVDQSALASALNRGAIGWAALDTLDPEPPSATHPLLNAPNVVLTPHSGFYSDASLNAAKTNAAEEALRVLRGIRPSHPVGGFDPENTEEDT